MRPPGRGTRREVPVLRAPGRQSRGLSRVEGRRGHPAPARVPRFGKRFTSYERIDEIPYMVVKKDGSRERFERQKLVAGLLKACEKRPVSVAALEAVADRVEATLQDRPEKEISTNDIGGFVMEELKKLDKVAYVRFASVYRHFRDINEFADELKSLLNPKE